MEKLTAAISFGIPDAIPDGCWLRLVAISFFSETDGEWLPILPEEKGLVVL